MKKRKGLGENIKENDKREYVRKKKRVEGGVMGTIN